MNAEFGDGHNMKKSINMDQPNEHAEEEVIDINNFQLGDGPLHQKMNRVSKFVNTVTDDNILYRQFMINQKKNQKKDEYPIMNRNQEIAQVYKGFNHHRT